LVPPLIVQLGLSGDSVQVTPAGSVSETTTLVAATPDAALLAVIVKLAVSPALIGVTFAVFVIETSVLAAPVTVTIGFTGCNVPGGVSPLRTSNV